MNYIHAVFTHERDRGLIEIPESTGSRLLGYIVSGRYPGVDMVTNDRVFDPRNRVQAKCQATSHLRYLPDEQEQPRISSRKPKNGGEPL